MPVNRRVGRPQGGPKGSTNEANALAEFLLTLTREMTVRELAGRYHVGKTLWGEYRTGQKIIPLELLRRLVRDRTPDERTRETRLETAERLHAAALEGAPHAPSITEPAPAPDLAMAPEPAAATEPAPAAGGRRRLTLIGGGTAIALLALLVLLLVWRPANVASIADGPGTPDAGGATAVLPASTEVFTIAPGGRGIFQWDGENAAGWTKIGDSARQLWAGSAGLFATGMDNKLYLYEGRPGRWHPISEPGADFAVAGSHLYRLAADRQSIHIWNGQGTSWTRIGGSAARLYGGELGLFAIALKDGSIFRYTGRPDQWDVHRHGGRHVRTHRETPVRPHPEPHRGHSLAGRTTESGLDPRGGPGRRPLRRHRRPLLHRPGAGAAPRPHGTGDRPREPELAGHRPSGRGGASRPTRCVRPEQRSLGDPLLVPRHRHLAPHRRTRPDPGGTADTEHFDNP